MKRGMKRVLADLHIHTALSPCASREMAPGAIVREAVRKGLDMIAICDHNSSGNVRAVISAACGELPVIPGIEVTSAEEVHVLGLFPDALSAEAVSRVVLERLPERPAGAAAGADEEQLLYGDDGEPLGSERRMLLAAAGIDLADVVELIRSHGGLVVAAHVDRPSFSVLSQLGFIPADVRFDAAEVSAAGLRRGKLAAMEALGLPLVSGSDSHSLEEIAASATALEVEAPAFEELRLALRGEAGRRCSCA